MALRRKRKSGAEQPPVDGNSEEASPWLELMRILPSILWFGLALFAFWLLYPVVLHLVESGAIQNVSVGVVKVELARVGSEKPEFQFDGIVLEEVQRNGRPPSEVLSKGQASLQPIDQVMQRQLAKLFNDAARKTKGANILWVDDKHPYQNAAERRVLVAAGMSVDRANTTDEALNWLATANYDILITDGTRKNGDKVEPCNVTITDSANSNAGCATINKVDKCFSLRPRDYERGEWQPVHLECFAISHRPGAKAPKMIMYSSTRDPSLGPPAHSVGITSRPDHLFRLILENLPERAMEPSSAPKPGCDFSSPNRWTCWWE
jgi:hypothetical protein